ncbi:MAG: HAD family hydrolase [Chloroflexota bacterium]|nr:HAD family hydrolase [Chloroflexota bacterium]
MINTVFFDFYNTLVKFWPPLDQLQEAACSEFGLGVSEEGIRKGYSVADVYFNSENARKPLALRSETERLEFFGIYEQMILENAGLPVSLDLATKIWQMASSIPKDFMPFDDTIEALSELRSDGFKLGLISNLRRDMRDISERVGLGSLLDFYITSADVGVEKPSPVIFKAALDSAAVSADQAIHVGDQHKSDVVGARNVGMHAILIDREGWNSKIDDCLIINTLSDLRPLLQDGKSFSTASD